MTKGLFGKLLPHLIAIVVFFIVAFLFSSPAFQGQVLQQHDLVGAKGMAQSAWNYYAEYGHLPLWNTHLFSGMPNYQIAVAGPSILPPFTSILSLGLPQPANYFFLACICFYILSLAFRINPYIGIFGALAFAYSTYNPVILNAGHVTKMMAICYAPALLAGLIWLYEKRYWLGLAVTTVFAAAEITANHPQINYYLLIIFGIATISYLVIWIKRGELKHAAIAISLALLGAAIGVGTSAVTLFTTFEYSKYTMRGGKTIENTGNEIVAKKTTGLDKDYAFSWSIGKAESVVLFLPNAFGGSSSETFDEHSKLVEELTQKNIPEASALQLASSIPKYWGGLESTSGPNYVGVLVFLLFVIGLVAVNEHHRVWIIAAIIFALFMAWGKYFTGFNDILFNFLPLYNKFRAPSMALVVPQILIPLMAILCLQKIFFTEPDFLSKERFKHILYAFGGLTLLAGIIYLTNDYSSEIDSRILEAYSGQQGGDEIGRTIVNGIKADRKAMLLGDILRMIGFALLLFGILYLWSKKILTPIIAISILIIINTIDLFAIGRKYLGEEEYVDVDTYTSANFTPTPADVTILQDKDPHFRVMNLSPDRFNESRTAYFHRSIGGYHPAKLRLFQDLIENQLSKPQLSMPVMNMLDTRYFLLPEQQGQGMNVQRNDSALGAAWFVNNIRVVNSPIEEMKALDDFNPAETAIIDKSTQAVTQFPVSADTSASIQLLKYDADTIVYKTVSPSPQFAVFSEIYYPAGWNAYLDGKKTDYYKVNYLLRGMPVPAGTHTIEFRFEPSVYSTSYSIALWSTIAMYIFIIGGFIMSYLEAKRRKRDVKST